MPEYTIEQLYDLLNACARKVSIRDCTMLITWSKENVIIAKGYFSSTPNAASDPNSIPYGMVDFISQECFYLARFYEARKLFHCGKE